MKLNDDFYNCLYESNPLKLFSIPYSQNLKRSFLPVVSLLFAVYTPAVRLAIHVELFGDFNAFFPAGPEVLVVKWNADSFPHGFTDGSDLFVFLELAVQEAAGKIIEFAVFGHEGSGSETVMVAVGAAIFLPKGNIAKKVFHVISFRVDNPHPDGIGIGFKSLSPLHAFRIGMNIVTVKISHHFKF